MRKCDNKSCATGNIYEMRPDYILLIRIAVIAIAGGLYLLREARRYRAKKRCGK